MDFSSPNLVRITCAPGLPPYVEQEVAALGHPVARVDRTGVETECTFDEAMRMNLHLRTAFAVLYSLRAFRCDGPDDLYRATKDIAWESILPPDGYVSVVSAVEHETIRNTMFANVRVKDGIVDRMTERVGQRPDSGADRTAGAVVHLHWRGSHARLALDLSGRKLSDRGYRRIPHVAPLQETLAAAIIEATGYDGSVPLVLPMAGSGTLAIEAALVARGRAPGLLRTAFAGMHLLPFDAESWAAARREALRARRKQAPAPIIVSDLDPKAIDAARRNAHTAGVEHDIELHVCDFAATPMPDGPGILVVNPEYGKRLGDKTELEATYARLGDFFKQRCAGYTAYIFTGALDLAKKVGLRTKRRLTFFNADLECRLLEYELYAGTRRGQPSATSEEPT